MTTHPTRISQMGELVDYCQGHITGAQLIVQTTGGHRFEVTGARFEGTSCHPEGRLVVTVSDCEHYSSEHAEGDIRDPVPADGTYAHPFYCERAECGNELTFDDIQAEDGLCSYCAESPDPS